MAEQLIKCELLNGRALAFYIAPNAAKDCMSLKLKIGTLITGVRVAVQCSPKIAF